MCSIPTTHIAARSLTDHSTFIAESIGTLHRRQNTSSLSEKFSSKLFRQLSLLRSETTPLGSPGLDLSSDNNSRVRRSVMCRHARHFSSEVSPTCQLVLHLQLRRPPISFPITLLLSTLVPKNAICSHFSIQRLV